MTVKVLEGSPPVEITLRRSARARRITLRVSGIDSRVTLTLPKGVSEREAMAFATQKREWIHAHIDAQDAPKRLRVGSEVPFEGQSFTIAQGQGRKVEIDGTCIRVPGPPDRMGARLAGFFKTVAQGRSACAADMYAAKLGRAYSGLTLRDTRSRWGSCSSEGRLMLSWRLIMAPPEVFDYVVAHEVSHLAEMNHSPAFWKTVETLYGPYDAPRLWLRQHGATLHRVRFTD